MDALREYLDAKEEAACTYFVVQMLYDGPMDGDLGPFDIEEEARQAIQNFELVIIEKKRPNKLEGVAR